MKRPFIIFLTALLALVLFVIFYPGKFQYPLNVIGRVLPYKEWVVSQDDNGLLTATYYNHTQGLKESTLVTEIERGDVMSFMLYPSIIPGAEIAKGDTIGRIDSGTLEREMANIEGDLRTEKALLKLAQSGEKQSIIEEARKQLDHAKEQLEEQRKIVERQERLKGSGYVPYQDYEIALNTMRLYALNVQMAEAALSSVQTGEKQEEIDLITIGIDALEREIKTLRDRQENLTLIAPLTGIILDTSVDGYTSPDGFTFPDRYIVDIADTSQYIVIMPITLRSRHHVRPQQKVEFNIQGIDKTLSGRILNLGNVVRFIRDEQVIIVTAILDTSHDIILPGTLVNCSIIIDSVTPLEYVARMVNTGFNR